MSFFELFPAKHCGMDISIHDDKEIEPTYKEASDGVLKVWVLWGECMNKECKTGRNLYYVRYKDPGGYGPHGRSQRTAELKKRCNTIEMFVVKRSHPITFAVVNAMVR